MPHVESMSKAFTSLFAFVALTAVSALSASAAPGDAQREHTRVGMQEAKSVLLSAAELGKGWLSGPAQNPGHITAACTGRLKPNESDLVEIGTDAEFSTRGVNYLLQTAVVYKTTADADAAWLRTLRASPAACMRKALRHIQVQPTRGVRLFLPYVAPVVTGYRIVGRFTAQGRVIAMYFDQVLARRGRTITRVFLTTFTRRAESSFENSLVRAIAKRLTARTPGEGSPA